MREVVFHPWVIMSNPSPRQSLVDRWAERLSSLTDLRQGWNGHDAPAPNKQSVANARRFLAVVASSAADPERVGASAAGGVAITFRKEDRKVLVECLNNDPVH